MELKNKDNLELWKKVQKTNPAYTKNANVGGNKITSIAPQYQIMNVTEQFGSYGSAWGFKNIELDYSLVAKLDLVVFKAIFFYPGGEFPIINSIKMFMDNAKTKVDDNFAKKIETDALTKAISKLGFNADIFMGKFDDTRYVDEMKKEFAEPIDENAPKQKTQLELAIEEMALVKDVKEMGLVWTKYKALQTNADFVKAKDDRKQQLNIK